MPGPTPARPETMVGQFYDGEAVSLVSADWTPVRTSKAFARALFVGGGGASATLKVDFAGTPDQVGATAQTITGIPSGTTLQIAVTKVYKTGTSCTNLFALY